MPRRQCSASAPPRRTAFARRSALLLLLVIGGLLGTAQAAMAATPQADIAYLNAAHQLNLTILQAATEAKTHGQTACVRQAAGVLETDHRKLVAQEIQVAGQLGILLVPIPSQAQRQKLTAVTTKIGTSGYDSAWLALQRQEHQSLLTLATAEAAKGTTPSVKSVAQETKTLVEMHLQMVQSTCKTVTQVPKVPTGDGGQMSDAQKLRLRTAMFILAVGVIFLIIKPPHFWRRALGVGAVILGILLLFAGPPGDKGQVPSADAAAAARDGALPPVQLVLPGYLSAPVEAVATGSNSQLQVPKSPKTVGWWAPGAAPGSGSGTVLLVGHVDTVSARRAVFAPLWNVPVGTKVSVKAGDGGEHKYQIVARKIYDQQALPADLFRGSGKPRLALVTCTGAYNPATHSYTHNLVLYGVPT